MIVLKLMEDPDVNHWSVARRLKEVSDRRSSQTLTPRLWSTRDSFILLMGFGGTWRPLWLKEKRQMRRSLSDLFFSSATVTERLRWLRDAANSAVYESLLLFELWKRPRSFVWGLSFWRHPFTPLLRHWCIYDNTKLCIYNMAKCFVYSQ